MNVLIIEQDYLTCNANNANNSYTRYTVHSRLQTLQLQALTLLYIIYFTCIFWHFTADRCTDIINISTHVRVYSTRIFHANFKQIWNHE